jgi:hypothetical protein
MTAEEGNAPMPDKDRRTVAEQLDDATTGEEFAGVLWRLFAAADAARDETGEVTSPYVGWLSPGDLEAGDALGYVDDDGQFAPGAAVVAVAPVPATGMWNITTHAGSLVLQGNADVFVFAGGAR